MSRRRRVEPCEACRTRRFYIDAQDEEDKRTAIEPCEARRTRRFYIDVQDEEDRRTAIEPCEARWARRFYIDTQDAEDRKQQIEPCEARDASGKDHQFRLATPASARILYFLSIDVKALSFFCAVALLFTVCALSPTQNPAYPEYRCENSSPSPEPARIHVQVGRLRRLLRVFAAVSAFRTPGESPVL